MRNGREEPHANRAMWTHYCLTKKHESAGLRQEVIFPQHNSLLAEPWPKDDTDAALCARYNSSSSVYHRVLGHPLEGNQRLLAPALEAPAGTFSSDA